MSIQHLSAAEVKPKITSGTKIVSIGADWCGPCKMMVPQLESLSEKVEVFKINVDNDKEYAQEMGVTGLPTTFIFKEGKPVEKFIGFTPKENIEGKL